MIAGAVRSVANATGKLYFDTLKRVKELFWYNPTYLFYFGIRFFRTALLKDKPVMPGPETSDEKPLDIPETATGRGSPPDTLEAAIVKMMVKSFFRGIIPVTVIGVAGGIAVGSLVGTIGPLIRTAIESPAMIILLANILPLILAILLAARNGAAIASRIALLIPTGKPPRLPGDRLLIEGLPSLVAAPFVGALFYAILAACLIAGYLVGSVGPIRIAVITPDVADNLGAFLKDYIYALSVAPGFIENHQVSTLLRDGALKSILFGAIVAYTATAFGTRSAEWQLSREAEYREFNKAVWESVVTALTICGIITFLMWTNV